MKLVVKYLVACATTLVMAAGCASSADAADDKSAAKKKYAVALGATPAKVVKDKEAKVKVTITPADGYVLKVETPFKAKLSCADGIEITKDSFSAKDFDDPKAAAKSVTTAFKATAAGKAEISADLTFFICNENLCERFKEKPQMSFSVK